MGKRLLIALPFVALLLGAGFWIPPVDSTTYDSARWIDSGLENERSGNLAAAERDLIRAAQVDRLFQPRWTLAGFYFRRQNAGQFWIYALQALAVGQRDLGALFDLCWQTSSDPEEIWTRVMPDRKATWNEYLFYLMTTGKWPAAASTALRIASIADSADKTPLMNYCDLALEHGDRAGSSAVWKSLGQRGLLPFSPGHLLTNGDFRTVPSGRGFDWRIPANSGVSVSIRNGEATYSLSGFESERLTLLQQPLALDPEKTYRLEFDYKAGGASMANGLHWAADATQSEGLSAQEWTRGRFEFAGTAASLMLTYQRPIGSSIAEGTISLRRLEVIAK